MPTNEPALTSAIPHNAEAERAVLGACLMDKRAANQVREQIKAEDFYLPAHQLIFACVSRLVDEGHPSDPVTVGDALRAQGQLESCGGIQYLSALMDAVPAPSAAPFYASIVADQAQMRELLAGMRTVLESVGQGMSAAQMTDMAEQLVFQVATSRRSGDLHPLSELLPEVFVQLSNIKAAGGVTGVPTFRELDAKYLSGLQKGDLIILAARPGCGKTSMALNIGAAAAADHGRRVAVFSLEMPKEQLVQRILCTRAKVDHARVRKGVASKEDFSRLQRAMAELGSAQLYIDDSMSVTISEMRSKCRKLRMDVGLDLVVVDYVQLMQGGSGRRWENRQLEVADMSRGLKAMAKELDVPVLALSQLSREADKGKEAPSLAHLRESGALEQDADVVILLSSKSQPKKGGDEEEEAKKDRSSDQVDVNVAKHRNGPTGVVAMSFIRPYTAFADLVQNWVGEAPPPPGEASEANEASPVPGDDHVF